jgi:hypothetical protein
MRRSCVRLTRAALLRGVLAVLPPLVVFASGPTALASFRERQRKA